MRGSRLTCYRLSAILRAGMGLLMYKSLQLFGSTSKNGRTALTGGLAPHLHTLAGVHVQLTPSIRIIRFDTNKSGNIDALELHQALSSFGYSLSVFLLTLVNFAPRVHKPLPQVHTVLSAVYTGV